MKSPYAGGREVQDDALGGGRGNGGKTQEGDQRGGGLLPYIVKEISKLPTKGGVWRGKVLGSNEKFGVI